MQKQNAEILNFYHAVQWRIYHEISHMGASTPKFGRQLQPIIWPIYTENCMKMKKIEPKGKGILYAPYIRHCEERILLWKVFVFLPPYRCHLGR